jgi:energy-coupling factor transport system ATP-binding protein
MIVARTEQLRFWPGRAARPALDGVTLEIAAGEVVLLEGPSGGGKSTLLRALAGLVPHFHGGRFAGRVTVLDRDTRSTTPAALATGVGSLFQDPETQAVRATVARDIAFGLENLAVPADRIGERIDDVLTLVRARHLRDREITTLSGGERQRAALAAVLALRPQLLLLDEPTSQLDDAGVDALEDTLLTLAASGVAIMIAEHHSDRLRRVVDRTIRLAAGRLVTTPDEGPDAGSPAGLAGSDLLEVGAIEARYGECAAITACSLALPAGTITALHGANGSGKSTLLRVITGLHAAHHGHVVVAGRDVTAVPAEARFPEVGFLPQDAGRRLLRERVDDEIASAARHVPGPAREERVVTLMAELDLTHLAAAHPLDLSVGERERVALATVLAGGPRVILLDEPSRGMDPARRAMLADALRRRAASGAAVLVATHDRAFAAAVADRHLELVEGRALGRTVMVRR